MKKYEIYEQDSIEYKALIDMFLDRFDATFKLYNKDVLRKIFLEKLNSICKVTSSVPIKKTFIEEIYNRLTKKIICTEFTEDEIFYELFYVLSVGASKKKESFFKYLLISCLGLKHFSVRDFEKGMTEYLTACLMGDLQKNIRVNLSQEATIINKLSKIFGDKMILDFYLGLNDELSENLNSLEVDGFKKLLNLCQSCSNIEEVPVPFGYTKYKGENGQIFEDDFLFRIFLKRKLDYVETIEDFKHNLHELFNFYEADLYKVCYDIARFDGRIEANNKDKNENFQTIHLNDIKKSARLFGKFNAILWEQWLALGIKDKSLYGNLVLDEIERFSDFASLIIMDYLPYWSNDLYQIAQKRKQPLTNSEDYYLLSNKNENLKAYYQETSQLSFSDGGLSDTDDLGEFVEFDDKKSHVGR